MVKLGAQLARPQVRISSGRPVWSAPAGSHRHLNWETLGGSAPNRRAESAEVRLVCHHTAVLAAVEISRAALRQFPGCDSTKPLGAYAAGSSAVRGGVRCGFHGDGGASPSAASLALCQYDTGQWASSLCARATGRAAHH